MYLIVVGAEKEGHYFVNLSVENNHEVTLIDSSEERARQVLKEHSIRVLVGNVAEDGILEEAEISRADAVIAATHDDAQNLMAMVLAKEYDVDILVSLVNHQTHDTIFKKLGVHIVSEPARVVAKQLYDYLG